VCFIEGGEFFFFFFFSFFFFSFFFFFFFRHYNFNSLNVLAFSTYNFQILRSWMQLVQFFIFSFLCHSLCHLPICSLVSLVVFLASVSTCVHFLPFFLLSFDVNGQTDLIFVLLCKMWWVTVGKNFLCQ
jgi:hypothetical protein